jgi:hypothetical protein
MIKPFQFQTLKRVETIVRISTVLNMKFYLNSVNENRIK